MENGEWGKGNGFSSAKTVAPNYFSHLALKVIKISTTSPVSVRKSGQAYMGIWPNHCVYFIFFFGSLLRVLQD